MALELDHLVVVAHDLAQGAAWCEATFGVVAAPGGTHALMGTHNLLLALGGAVFARSYLEIIAIDPDAAPPQRARWFGMDDAALQGAVRSAPRLVHWAARTDGLEVLIERFAALGLPPGPALAAQRGTLRWRITVPDDGLPLCNGAWPTLIEWRGPHPADSLPASGVALRAITLRCIPPKAAPNLDVPGLSLASAPGPAIEARFETPGGELTLSSEPGHLT
jgi:Glyoxalase-like domain